jgi:hypothetical protein
MTVYGKIGPAQGIDIAFKVLMENDLAELIEKAEKASLRNLYKAAGLIHTTAARSIKRAPKEKLKAQGRDGRGRFTKAVWQETGRRLSSKPGKPPYTHGDPGPLKALMKFGLAEESKTVVVGPMKFESAKAPDVPHLLEFGGVSINRNRQKYKLEPRPYMRPAEEKSRTKYPQYWQDSI